MAIERYTAALAGLLLALPWPGAGVATAQGDHLAGIWTLSGYEKSLKVMPELVNLPDGNDAPHGTFESHPYLQILSAPDGSLQLFSDVGALWVELVPDPHRDGIYALRDLTPGSEGTIFGHLHHNAPLCQEMRHPACFQVTPAKEIADGDFPIPFGRDVQYVPLASETLPHHDETFGDIFANQPFNFDFLQLCYSLAPKSREHSHSLNLTDFQEDTGCDKLLFALPSDASKTYMTGKVTDSDSVAWPPGWQLVPKIVHNGKGDMKTIDTGRELSNSNSLDIGVKASVNLFGFEAETDVSVATSEKLDNLIETKSVQATAQTLNLHYAFVMNRRYAAKNSLNPDFKTAVLNLKGKPFTDEAYQVLINDWGTHYANAVTFGSRGTRTATLNQQTINTLREKGTNIEAGLTAGYAGTKLGVDTKVANQSLSDLKEFREDDKFEYTCYGGTDCNDGHPSGTDLVPIFLDLRPLSDLLAPPYFAEEGAILGEVRHNLSQAIHRAAYKRRNDLDTPTMTVVNAVNPAGTPLASPQLLCGDQAVTRSPSSASQVTKDYCCAPLSAAVPVVAALSLEGVADPIVRPADRPAVNEPVKLGAAVPVNLPSQDDPKPFVSGVTVDYGFYWQRDDPVQYGVYAPNIDAFCQAQIGDGYSGSMTPQGAICVSGPNSQSVKLDDVCQSEYQSPYHPYWSDVENAWFCSFQMTKPVDASAWCSMVHGAGSVAKYYTYYDVDGFDESSWGCEPGGQFDENAVCGAMAGRTFKAAGPDKDDNLQCTGLFEGVHMAEAADASIKTYPDLSDYDPAKGKQDTPVNVVVPLTWTGDAATTCNGVNLDLVIGLQTVPADTLIAGP